MFTLSPVAPGSTQPAIGPIDMIPNPAAAALNGVSDAFGAFVDVQSAVNPVHPMWLQPGQRPVGPDLGAATAAAARGLAALDQALAAYPVVRNETRRALEAAAQQARQGQVLLNPPTSADVEVDVQRIVSTYDAAIAELRTAGNLLARELGRPGFDPIIGC